MIKNESNERILNLEILHSGIAAVNKEWNGKAIRSQYSRLYFIKSGSFFVVGEDGRKTVFSENGVYLIPSGYSYIYGCDNQNEHCYFHIRLFGLDKTDLLGRLKEPIFCKNKNDMESFSSIIISKQTASSLAIKSEIYSALSMVALRTGNLLDAPVYSHEISEAINYISNNLRATLSVKEIADYAGIAKSTLSMKFRREVGMSVGEYVDYRVVFTAMQMLISTNKSISEISDYLGFCDQFYFSRRFKDSYGISPKKFRNTKNPV